jgi:hypothetical protein
LSTLTAAAPGSARNSPREARIERTSQRFTG